MKNVNRPNYQRRHPLVLVNGLAEQSESWYCNVDAWRKHFDVHTPSFLVYDGIAIQRRIAAGQPIDVDYLVEQLHLYVESFVQRSPVFLVANSLGGKIAVEFTTRYPELVSRLVLLCPSWKRWGTAKTAKPGTVILHARADDIVPFTDSEELVRNSGLPASALIEVGTDHWLGDPASLAKMVEMCERSATS